MKYSKFSHFRTVISTHFIERVCCLTEMAMHELLLSKEMKPPEGNEYSCFENIGDAKSQWGQNPSGVRSCIHTFFLLSATLQPQGHERILVHLKS
jgi:hypothetical protein